jgi:hypothetical protein
MAFGPGRFRISGYTVGAATVPGRLELPPIEGVFYSAFVDPSGGSSDAMTLALGHSEDGRVVIDAIRERRPPFSPADVVAEFADLLRSYRISSVSGDRYGGEWPRERFLEHGIAITGPPNIRSRIFIASSCPF